MVCCANETKEIEEVVTFAVFKNIIHNMKNWQRRSASKGTEVPSSLSMRADSCRVLLEQLIRRENIHVG